MTIAAMQKKNRRATTTTTTTTTATPRREAAPGAAAAARRANNAAATAARFVAAYAVCCLVYVFGIVVPVPARAATHSELAPVANLFIDSVPFLDYAANSTLAAAIMRGSTLNVTFSVLGFRFSASALSSIPVASVWDHSSTSAVAIQMPDGSTLSAETPDLHYSGSLDDGSASVTATLYDDGIHMVIFNATSGRLFQVDPVAHIVNAFSKQEFDVLAGASHASFVPSKVGVGEPIRVSWDPVIAKLLPNSSSLSNNGTANAPLQNRRSRRTIPDVPIPSVGYAPLWDDCFPNILQNHTARIAFYVTYGSFLQLDGAGATSPVRTLAKLGQAVTDMNIIYQHQLRITIQVHTSKTKIMMAPHTDPSANYAWNYGPGYCSKYNTDALHTLQNHLTTQPTDDTVTSYFLLTSCTSAGGEDGNAYQPGACSDAYNAGSVVLDSFLWLTMAHEFGHNINASHAFEDGQGTTGGVMDYADGRYPIGTGYYGFHPVYNKPDICPYLARFQGTACLPRSRDVVVAGENCGNGVVDADEDCDPGPGRSSPCCTGSCRFVRECDYAAADPGAAACCRRDCTFAGAGTVCGRQSMCRNGACLAVRCSEYSNINACALGDCAYGCWYDGESADQCYDGSAFGWDALAAPDGTRCGDGSATNVCTSGVCTVSPGPPRNGSATALARRGRH
ncbi:hypothetical protein DFJ73DRAFT_773371 [Zopfochytrium polystomum]|nr:hypothetical protein DFJ73DRAFT_773371 [Zopfochytrium polystomum]